MVGKNKFLNAKQIKWNEKWMGSTQYIDSARITDFPDKNQIYYGIDSYQRAFIFVKIQNCLLSIFQRYTDANTFVVVEPTGKMNKFLGGQVAINDELRLKLKNII